MFRRDRFPGWLRLIERQEGQSTVELIAAAPLVAVVLFGAWQLAVAGQSWWSISEAARLSARASSVARFRGESVATAIDTARRQADAVLSNGVQRSRIVEVGRAEVRVSARVPLVGPFTAVFGEDAGPMLSARSGFAP
jgi:hypothetical protein